MSVAQTLFVYQSFQLEAPTLMNLVSGQTLPLGPERNKQSSSTCFAAHTHLPCLIEFTDFDLGLPTYFMRGGDCMALKTKQPRVRHTAKGGNRLQTSPFLFL